VKALVSVETSELARMAKKAHVLWLLAFCFAVLAMGDADSREEGELEDDGEDEYYGSEFWGEGQARRRHTARADLPLRETPTDAG
jgi:hypothetical protein